MTDGLSDPEPILEALIAVSRARTERIRHLERTVKLMTKLHDKDVAWLRERVERLESLLAKRPCRFCSGTELEHIVGCEVVPAMEVRDL